MYSPCGSGYLIQAIDIFYFIYHAVSMDTLLILEQLFLH